jgi:chromosome segregation ATPase
MDQPGNHILVRGNQTGAADRMRELLARTVQDHVADQRSNAGALEDIRQRLEGLEWLAKEVREREITGLGARLDQRAGQLEAAAAKPPGWAESLAEHIELLRTQVMPLAELPSLWADMGTVAEHVEQALPRLQQVGDSVGLALEALRAQDERLGRLQQGVTKLQQSMETAAGRFNRLDKAVAELTQRTAQLDKEISGVKGRAEVGFSALAAKLDQSAEATAARVADATETIAAVTRGLGETVTGLGGQVDVIGSQVQVVHGSMERLAERLADTDDKLDSLDAKLTSTDAKVGTADARVAALDTKLERLDERLDDQYDRVSLVDKELGSVDGKLGSLQSKLGPVDSKLGAVDSRLGTVDGKVGALGGRLDGLDGRMDGVAEQIDGLGEKFGAVEGRLGAADGHFAELGRKLDELRSRPGSAEIHDTMSQVVDAAKDQVAARLGSLEETVLTLAEALLRPAERQPAARESGHN